MHHDLLCFQPFGKIRSSTGFAIFLLLIFNAKSASVGSSSIVRTVTEKSRLFPFTEIDVKGGHKVRNQNSVNLSTNSGKHFVPKRARRRRPRRKMAKKEFVATRAEKSRGRHSKDWLNSVISDTVVIEIWSSPGIDMERSLPTPEFRPSKQHEIINDRRKISKKGKTDWEIAAKPLTQTIKSVYQEKPSREKPAYCCKQLDWEIETRIENAYELKLHRPTTPKPRIAHSEGVKISDDDDVYEFPQILFYENVKRLVPR